MLRTLRQPCTCCSHSEGRWHRKIKQQSEMTAPHTPCYARTMQPSCECKKCKRHHPHLQRRPIVLRAVAAASVPPHHGHCWALRQIKSSKCCGQKACNARRVWKANTLAVANSQLQLLGLLLQNGPPPWIAATRSPCGHALPLGWLPAPVEEPKSPRQPAGEQKFRRAHHSACCAPWANRTGQPTPRSPLHSAAGPPPPTSCCRTQISLTPSPAATPGRSLGSHGRTAARRPAPAPRG